MTELKQALRHVKKLNMLDLQAVVDHFDYNGDGVINYREFLALCGPSATVYAAKTIR